MKQISILLYISLSLILAGNLFAQQTPAFSYQVNDSVSVQVELVRQDGHAQHYSSHLVTDVCSDGLCKPVHMTVYWDLLGNFQSYQTDPSHPLTKFDHIKMTPEDHQRLHEILSDTASILRDYWVEDMIDTSVKVQSNTLDAVTGATMKTFDGATVEGALYTVYTLWHFINGGIRKELLAYTDNMIDDSLIAYMLGSENRDYLGYIFDKADPEKLREFIPEVIALVESPDAYIPHFALSWLPDTVLENPAHQTRLIRMLPGVDSHLQNALLQRFGQIPLQPEGIDALIQVMGSMENLQVEKIADLLYRNKSRSGPAQWTALRKRAEKAGPEIKAAILALLRKVE